MYKMTPRRVDMPLKSNQSGYNDLVFVVEGLGKYILISVFSLGVDNETK